MSSFTFYKKSTGEILRWGSVDLDELEINTDVDECAIEGIYDGNSYYIMNGVPTIFPNKQFTHYKFNWESHKWFDSRTLENVKSEKNLDISNYRLKANQSTFSFKSKQIAVDPLSRGDIDAVHGIVVLTNEMPEGWVGGWKAVDNTFVSIPDVATWALFYKAMVGQGSINFAHAQQLKAQLAAATTIEEADAIVW